MKILRDELYEIGTAYVRIAKNPTTLITGTFKVAKDILFDAPRTLFHNENEEELKDAINRNKRLNIKSSASLAMSELAGYFGAFFGSEFFSKCGSSPYIAANIGGNIGNYISAASTFLLCYSLSTRKEHRIENTSALRTGFSYVARAFPAAVATYLTYAPLVSGLIALNVQPEAAATIGSVVSSVVFTSAAKTVIDR